METKKYMVHLGMVEGDARLEDQHPERTSALLEALAHALTNGADDSVVEQLCTSLDDSAGRVPMEFMKGADRGEDEGDFVWRAEHEGDVAAHKADLELLRELAEQGAFDDADAAWEAQLKDFELMHQAMEDLDIEVLDDADVEFLPDDEEGLSGEVLDVVDGVIAVVKARQAWEQVSEGDIHALFGGDINTKVKVEAA